MSVKEKKFIRLEAPPLTTTLKDPPLFGIVQIVSHIRGICRYTPIDDDSLAPRVMIIPEDPLGSGDGQQSPWNPDTKRLLKAVDEQSLDGIENLLNCGASVNAHGGAFHETALHTAAQQGWVEGVKLLLSLGANVNTTNQYEQTPLHYAAASKSYNSVKALLVAGCKSTLDHKDMRGHTPLHDAASVGHPEGVAMLLKEGANVDARDKNGETPLFKAAKSKCINSMLALLNKGADFEIRDKQGESVLGYVLRHIPAAMETIFDYCLVTNSNKISTKKLEVNFNFIPISGNSVMNQMKILNAVVSLGHPKLLLHPLCEAFLLLKWHNVRRLFFIEVIFYFLHTILATILISNKFVWKLDNVDISFIKSSGWQNFFDGIVYILYFQAIIMLLKQLLTIIHGVRTWLFSMWHVLNAVIPILVLVMLPGERRYWQHHLASISLLLIWVQCMLHIGRFPGCGIYVAMFTRVAKVFLRIFLIFCCLLIAFSMSFYVSKFGGEYEEKTGINLTNDQAISLVDVKYMNEYYAIQNNSETKNITMLCTKFMEEEKKKEIDQNRYVNPLLTFMETLTMMIGELDFDRHYVTQLNYLMITSHLIFLAFVILVSIILSNLLVALAVNDVQGLRNSAHLERLIKQMELVFQMEKTFGIVERFPAFMKIQRLSAKIQQWFVHDFGNTKVFMQPYNPQKGSKILVVKFGNQKEINLRQSHVMHIMECLRLREEENSDRKMSMRKSRKVRSNYSAFTTTNDDMRDSLKLLERNLLETMNDRLDEMAETFQSLIKKIEVLEVAVAPSTGESTKNLFPGSKQPSTINKLNSHHGSFKVKPDLNKHPVAKVRQSQPAMRHNYGEQLAPEILRPNSQPLTLIPNQQTPEVVIEMRQRNNSTDENSKDSVELLNQNI